jgi:hypothetical protein
MPVSLMGKRKYDTIFLQKAGKTCKKLMEMHAKSITDP